MVMIFCIKNTHLKGKTKGSALDTGQIELMVEKNILSRTADYRVLKVEFFDLCPLAFIFAIIRLRRRF